ncbi:arylsulfatase [Sesbania bispinosa]|nr:arylsulfatase [Sesbania bispinosa]
MKPLTVPDTATTRRPNGSSALQIQTLEQELVKALQSVLHLGLFAKSATPETTCFLHLHGGAERERRHGRGADRGIAEAGDRVPLSTVWLCSKSVFTFHTFSSSRLPVPAHG